MVIIKKKKTDCLNSFSSVRILKTENENDKIHCGGPVLQGWSAFQGWLAGSKIDFGEWTCCEIRYYLLNYKSKLKSKRLHSILTHLNN